MLTITKSEKYFFQMLRTSGFDPKKVTPMQVWEVFKEFCAIPVRCLREVVLVECGNFYLGENLFHITFVREFIIEDKTNEIFVQLHCDFTCEPNPNLPDEQIFLWSREFPDLPSYFTEAENLISFQKAMQEPAENWGCDIIQFAQ